MSWERYEKLRTLGQGAFGTVYLCRDQEAPGDVESDLVAVKCVSLTSMGEDEARLAMSEAAILRNLEHKNILRFIDCYIDDESMLCTVTEFVDGGDLSALLRHAKKEAPSGSEGYVDAMVVADIAEQMLSGLAYLHEHHVLHRDIKPANIYLTRQGTLKIGDFGVSKLVSASMPNAATFIGTPYYISPELALGDQYSYGADVWSFGVLIYELYCNKLPFYAANVLALIHLLTEAKFDTEALHSRPYGENAATGGVGQELQAEICALVAHLVEAALTSDKDARPTASQLLSAFFNDSAYAPPPDDDDPDLQAELDALDPALYTAEGWSEARLEASLAAPTSGPTPVLVNEGAPPVDPSAAPSAAVGNLSASELEQRIRSKALVHHRKRLVAAAKRRAEAKTRAASEPKVPVQALTPATLGVPPSVSAPGVSPMKRVLADNPELKSTIRAVAAQLVANEAQASACQDIAQRGSRRQAAAAPEADDDSDDEDKITVQVIDIRGDRGVSTKVRPSATYKRLVKNVRKALGLGALGGTLSGTSSGLDGTLTYLDADNDLITLQCGSDWKHVVKDHQARYPGQPLSLRYS